jgi:hypothetical protein
MGDSLIFLRLKTMLAFKTAEGFTDILIQLVTSIGTLSRLRGTLVSPLVQLAASIGTLVPPLAQLAASIVTVSHFHFGILAGSICTGLGYWNVGLEWSYSTPPGQ